jgi:ABC-type sugar transport system ATPase subunit
MKEVSVKREYPLLVMENVSKKFGEVTALSNVDLILNYNEVLGLVGDNGAGKSTLIKILSGIYAPDSARILIEGREVKFKCPRDAAKFGIGTLHQKMEEILAPNHDVTANIFMGEELTKPILGGFLKVLDKTQMDVEAQEILSRIRIGIDSVKRPITSYSGGQRQAAAIGKAIRQAPKILILDEPTAALGVSESIEILRLIKHLRQQGISIIVISHNLEHIFGVVDRIVVLRNGRKVGECIAKETDMRKIVSLIVGAEKE